MIKTDKVLEDFDLQPYALACLWISSKYEDIYAIKLKNLIANDIIDSERIKLIEGEILEALEFKILIPTVYDWLNF